MISEIEADPEKLESTTLDTVETVAEPENKTEEGIFSKIKSGINSRI